MSVFALNPAAHTLIIYHSVRSRLVFNDTFILFTVFAEFDGSVDVLRTSDLSSRLQTVRQHRALCVKTQSLLGSLLSQAAKAL